MLGVSRDARIGTEIALLIGGLLLYAAALVVPEKEGARSLLTAIGLGLAVTGGACLVLEVFASSFWRKPPSSADAGRGKSVRPADTGNTPLPGHGVLGVGRNWIRCHCGWTGSAQDFERHQTGDLVPSPNQPLDPAVAAPDQPLQNELHPDEKIPAPRPRARAVLETIRGELNAAARGRGPWRQLLSGVTRYDDAAAYATVLRGRAEFTLLPEEIRELVRQVILASVKRAPGHDYHPGLSIAVDSLILHLDDALRLAEDRIAASMPHADDGLAKLRAPAAADSAAPVVSRVAPAEWSGPEAYRSGFIENGLPLYYCPYCAFRTTDGPETVDAHINTAHELDPRSVEDWYDDPQPWAQEAVYFVAPTKDRYVSGVPADDLRTLYVSSRRAEELVNTGLYARGVAPYAWRRGADEVGTADRFGRQVRRHANADGWFIPRGAGEASILAGLTRPNRAVARDLRTLVSDLREFLQSNKADFDGNRPPDGATAEELRRAAMFDDRIASAYRDSYRARIQPLVAELERSGLDRDPDWTAMSGERVRWRDMPRLVDSLDRAAKALEARPDV